MKEQNHAHTPETTLTTQTFPPVAHTPPLDHALPTHSPDTQSPSRFAWLRSPLWICLLLTVLVRVWIIWTSHSFLDADEALVGLQAQHILQGERPAYFYGQPYMGSLEAYLIAGMFVLVGGTSVWALRLVPLVLSLILVWLTWHVAGELTKKTVFSSGTRRWFMTAAGLLAALPPLYNLIMGMRTWGGHSEIYILMLALLYAVLRITRRWDHATRRELALRWVAIGIIIGASFWIYPLIISAMLAMLIWLAVFFLLRWLPFLSSWKHLPTLYAGIRMDLLKLLPALCALPACLVGFAPGIYWGMHNNWENVIYLFAPGSDGGNDARFAGNRLALLAGTVQLYARCLAPQVLGGSLSSQSLTMNTPFSFWTLTILGAASLFGTALLLLLSCHPRYAQHTLLLNLRKLAALPLLFAFCTIFIFCFSSTVGGSIYEPCTRDGVGRYAAPILVALPFIGAALLTAFYHVLQHPRPISINHEHAQPVRPGRRYQASAMLLPLALYIALISNTYLGSNTHFLFQSFTCLYAPFDNQPIIDYMQRENIRYAWGTTTVGNAVMFETNSEIIVVDSRIVAGSALNRLPENARAVELAERASLIDMVPETEMSPQILQDLDEAGIQYKLARFSTDPGNVAVLIITPLNRTLTAEEARSPGSWSLRC